eukprot:TRINITY_DN1989_c0_g1_i2.p1 TRINITY_DN1989_c0_g1~~TRINITY_DN1989_c0_g1_i2.p1  ORF type:complete len:309 (-),score=18.31 TRINITY_DN1989_c0_g1_i2:74-1000(-)
MEFTAIQVHPNKTDLMDYICKLLKQEDDEHLIARSVYLMRGLIQANKLPNITSPDVTLYPPSKQHKPLWKKIIKILTESGTRNLEQPILILLNQLNQDELYGVLKKHKKVVYDFLSDLDLKYPFENMEIITRLIDADDYMIEMLLSKNILGKVQAELRFASYYSREYITNILKVIMGRSPVYLDAVQKHQIWSEIVKVMQGRIYIIKTPVCECIFAACAIATPIQFLEIVKTQCLQKAIQLFYISRRMDIGQDFISIYNAVEKLHKHKLLGNDKDLVKCVNMVRSVMVRVRNSQRRQILNMFIQYLLY